MAKTLQEMLGYVAQTGIIQSPKGGIPDNILPAEFHRVTRRIKGDQFKFKLVAGNRKLAKRVNRGDPFFSRWIQCINLPACQSGAGSLVCLGNT